MEKTWVDGVERGALLSACGKYRYLLTRVWKEQAPRVCFVMLNPSTADAHEDDATIRRCIGFAKSWGYGSLEVVNLYAWRATDPKDLWKAVFPVGSENDRYIQEAVRRSTFTVAAWGANAKYRHRVQRVAEMIQNAVCLGRTKEGAPYHPLRLRADTQIEVYCLRGIIRPA